LGNQGTALMASVTFPDELGGNETTVTDDANPVTGLAGGGHRTRLVPALAQFVAVAANVIAQCVAQVAAAAAQVALAAGHVATAAASAASAINAPGTNATSVTSLTIGTGTKAFVLAQANKAYSVGQKVVIASTAAPATNWMSGQISAFNSATGAITVEVTEVGGAGTIAAWTVSLTAVGGISPARAIATSGLATGGGTLAADRTIDVAAAGAADMRAGTSAAKAVTPLGIYDALAPVALTDATTITPDFATGIDFTVTLAGNRTLANPTNAKVGERGTISIKQDATGSRTLAYGTAWKRENGAPTLTTTANATDYLVYEVKTVSGGVATLILFNLIKSPT
jgi:hypothetical protein